MVPGRGVQQRAHAEDRPDDRGHPEPGHAPRVEHVLAGGDDDRQRDQRIGSSTSDFLAMPAVAGAEDDADVRGAGDDQRRRGP